MDKMKFIFIGLSSLRLTHRPRFLKNRHGVCKKVLKILLKNLSWNQFTVGMIFGENIDYTEFFYKIPVIRIHWELHSVENREILCHWNFFSSNQLFSNFFRKNIAFTKFLSKMCERISETTLCIITDFFREIEIFTQLFLDHFRLLIFSDLSSCEIVSCELWISKNARKVTRYLLEIDTAKCSKQLIFDMIRVLILIHPKLVSRKNRQNDNKASATL